MFFTQLRTEFDSFRLTSSTNQGRDSTLVKFIKQKIPIFQHGQLPDHDNVLGPDVWAVRIAAFISIVIGIMGVVTLLSMSDGLYQQLVMIAIQVNLQGLVIPIVVILRNESMSKYCKQIFKYFFQSMFYQIDVFVGQK